VLARTARYALYRLKFSEWMTIFSVRKLTHKERRMNKSSRKSPVDNRAGGAVPGAPSITDKEQRTPWRTMVLTALMTIFPTLLGVYVTNQYQLRQWGNEKMYTMQADLLSRRFGLVERFMKISRHESDLSSLYALRQQDLKEMQEAISNKDVAKARELMRQSSDDNHRFDELNSEYLTVMSMAVELFGPKTQAAVAVIVKNHNPQFWEASEEEKSGVVEAMSGEVLLNLVDVPAETKVMGSIGPNGSTRTVQ